MTVMLPELTSPILGATLSPNGLEIKGKTWRKSACQQEFKRGMITKMPRTKKHVERIGRTKKKKPGWRSPQYPINSDLYKQTARHTIKEVKNLVKNVSPFNRLHERSASVMETRWHVSMRKQLHQMKVVTGTLELEGDSAQGPQRSARNAQGGGGGIS